MCGIAGFALRERPAAVEMVRKMCDQIQHRGPDDAGYYTNQGCGIGMRRLSIIDLSTGHQPISNEDGSIWIVFNGEIYNYQNLRRDLLARGHRFTTNTDTETIVHLYEEQGPALFSQLRGMFACAIWDSRRGELLLARDRFGKKPLYYAALPEGLYFGSELKCLRAAQVPLDLDPASLRLYFQFGYIPDPLSPFQQVRKLPGGTSLVYRPATGTHEIQRFWQLPRPASTSLTFAEAQSQVRATVDEAVRLRMIADVPLGAFLSGGIDSSIVVASMASQSRQPVKTFAIGFEEASHNELPFAKLVAERYGAEHHEILLRPDSVDLAQRLVRYFDEPFADSSAIPTFLVSEFAVRHVKVALSGDGGDELFAGYPRFAEVAAGGWGSRLPGAGRLALGAASRLLPYRAYGKNYLHMLSRPSAFQRYLERNFSPYFLRSQLLTPEWMLPRDGGYLQETFGEFLLPDSFSDLDRAMYFEAAVHLTGDMLVKVDRMSMANSLEVRSPLLDQELAGLAATLPAQWKIHGDPARPALKHILVEAFRDRLPREVFDRPKQGFAVPLVHWMRGPMLPLLQDRLLAPGFLQRGIVRGPFIRDLISEHSSGRRDNSAWLWSLLMLDLWFQEIGR